MTRSSPATETRSSRQRSWTYHRAPAGHRQKAPAPGRAGANVPGLSFDPAKTQRGKPRPENHQDHLSAGWPIKIGARIYAVDRG